MCVYRTHIQFLFPRDRYRSRYITSYSYTLTLYWIFNVIDSFRFPDLVYIYPFKFQGYSLSTVYDTVKMKDMVTVSSCVLVMCDWFVFVPKFKSLYVKSVGDDSLPLSVTSTEDRDPICLLVDYIWYNQPSPPSCNR